MDRFAPLMLVAGLALTYVVWTAGPREDAVLGIGLGAVLWAVMLTARNVWRS